ncbi:MAG TPA: cyclic peptide export ABC transporter [Rhizomicrobium sp.]|nr:cyclic peptide export ABC transporter [Rhizomicrobium sp.]
MFALLSYLNREMKGASARIVAALLVAGLSRGALLAIFNAGAAQAVARTISWQMPAAFFAVLILYLLSGYDSIRHSVNAVEVMRERIRVRLAEKLLFAHLRFLEIKGTGDLYTQLGADLQRLRDAAMTFLNAAQAAILVIFSLAYLAWLSWPAFFATLITGALGAAAYYRIDSDMQKRIAHARDRETALFDALADTLRGFKELKLGRARQRDHTSHVASLARDFRELWVTSETLYQLVNIVSQAFMFLLIAIVAFVVPLFTQVSGVAIFQVVATILFVMTPLETLLSSIPSLSKARVSLGSIEQLESNLDSDAAEVQEPSPAPLSFEKISFRNVHFRFESALAEEGFDVGPLDLDIRRNEILFVVGGNGAGKTTFLKLLTGLYQPMQGAIEIDGRTIAKSDSQSYREMFAAVFGDFHLFTRLYGLGNPDPATVRALLSELGIANKTQVRGNELSTVDLSTGQRKRLAYAVNRLADRQIYVFDEFAADQDPQFRAYFYTELLPRLKRDGKTVVAVTHDDRWFAAADRVLKMDYGRIAEIVEHPAGFITS